MVQPLQADGEALQDDESEPGNARADEPVARAARIGSGQQGPQACKSSGSRIGRSHQAPLRPSTRPEPLDEIIGQRRRSGAVEAVPRQEGEADPAQDNPAECCP